MTRKLWNAIAKIISDERAFRGEDQLDKISKKLADLFEDNFQGQFDWGRFMKACGVENESV